MRELDPRNYYEQLEYIKGVEKELFELADMTERLSDQLEQRYQYLKKIYSTFQFQ